MSLLDVRKLFFERSNLRDGGGYAVRWVKVEAKPLLLRHGGTPSRRADSEVGGQKSEVRGELESGRMCKCPAVFVALGHEKRAGQPALLDDALQRAASNLGVIRYNDRAVTSAVCFRITI